MWNYQKALVACIQAAPVFLDAAKTTDKACHLIREAGAKGAKVIALPEAFIPGYPYWNWMMSPMEGSQWFKKLYKSSILVPGPETLQIGEAARDAGAFVVVGVNERSPVSSGTIYNSNLVFNPEGKLVGRHRKLVPTFAEKLTWATGDGSSLKTYPTPYGPLGTLACGENTNTLARFTLLSHGELIHIANFIGWPFTDDYDMVEAIKIRCGAHSFEGKLFTLVASSPISDEMRDMLGTTPERLKMLTGAPNTFSGIFGPSGTMIVEPLIDQEGILFAEIDPDCCIEPKQFHDIIGHYNRFDIFELRVNRKTLSPVTTTDIASDTAEIAEPNTGEVLRVRDLPTIPS